MNTKLIISVAFRLGVALLLSSDAHASAQSIHFGIAAEPYPPFSTKDASGQWIGWEMDMMKAVCADVKAECIVDEAAWDGLIPALQAKKFDAIMASMAITEKRMQVIAFSDMYYNSAPVLIGAKNASNDVTPTNLKGKVIGVQVASIHAAYAAKHFTPEGATVNAYAKLDDATADLAAGRIDYVLGEGISLGAFLNGSTGACCATVGIVAADPDIFGRGVGFGLRKEDAALTATLNKGIADIAADGTLSKITEHWKLTGKIVLPAMK